MTRWESAWAGAKGGAPIGAPLGVLGSGLGPPGVAIMGGLGMGMAAGGGAIGGYATGGLRGTPEFRAASKAYRDEEMTPDAYQLEVAREHRRAFGGLTVEDTGGMSPEDAAQLIQLQIHQLSYAKQRSFTDEARAGQLGMGDYYLDLDIRADEMGRDGMRAGLAELGMVISEEYGDDPARSIAARGRSAAVTALSESGKGWRLGESGRINAMRDVLMSEAGETASMFLANAVGNKEAAQAELAEYARLKRKEEDKEPHDEARLLELSRKIGAVSASGAGAMAEVIRVSDDDELRGFAGFSLIAVREADAAFMKEARAAGQALKTGGISKGAMNTAGIDTGVQTELEQIVADLESRGEMSTDQLEVALSRLSDDDREAALEYIADTGVVGIGIAQNVNMRSGKSASVGKKYSGDGAQGRLISDVSKDIGYDLDAGMKRYHAGESTSEAEAGVFKEIDRLTRDRELSEEDDARIRTLIADADDRRILSGTAGGVESTTMDSVTAEFADSVQRAAVANTAFVQAVQSAVPWLEHWPEPDGAGTESTSGGEETASPRGE